LTHKSEKFVINASYVVIIDETHDECSSLYDH